MLKGLLIAESVSTVTKYLMILFPAVGQVKKSPLILITVDMAISAQISIVPAAASRTCNKIINSSARIPAKQLKKFFLKVPMSSE